MTRKPKRVPRRVREIAHHMEMYDEDEMDGVKFTHHERTLLSDIRYLLRELYKANGWKARK